MNIRIKRNATKAWSTWGIAAIALVEGIKGAWPLLSEQLPAPVYDYGLFGLAGLVLVLRFIDQGLDNA